MATCGTRWAYMLGCKCDACRAAGVSYTQKRQRKQLRKGKCRQCGKPRAHRQRNKDGTLSKRPRPQLCEKCLRKVRDRGRRVKRSRTTK